MGLNKNRIIWLPSLVIILVGLAIRRLRRPGRELAAGRASDPREDPATRRRGRRWRVRGQTIEELRRNGLDRGIAPIVALALLASLVGAALNGPLTERSIYTHTHYESIPGLPAGGKVRLVPRDVAVQITSSGFNSPTEHLTDFRIVKTPRGLAWTALRTPDGLVRIFTKKTTGIVTLDAESTARNVKATDARFQIAPHLQITDNVRWQLLKRHYFIDLTDPVSLLDAQGRPIMIVPYITYKGFLIRHPVLGGVFVVHPNGRIEDLSPKAARARREIASSGRLFPDHLARRYQDAYAYKRGIWNKFFLHAEQTQITDTESNQQPYLIDFGARGAKWVTVAEPYGRAFAVNAIFLTDTVTGHTQIWRVPPNASYSGNQRAIQTVRSVSIPGIVYADQAAPGQATGGGRFAVVEPRPVFVSGRLVYLVSIIPESANAVSKSVIVDAASNKVIKIFNNDTDPSADRKVLLYLATGQLSGGPTSIAPPAGKRPATNGRNGRPAVPAPAAPPPNSTLAKRLDQLIARQEEILRQAKALRKSLNPAR